METVERLKIKRSNAGVSTVVAEMLILALTLILAAAFVASLDSNVSYYIQSKPLSSVNVWTTSPSTGWVNFTATNVGGDATEIRGQIYFESQGGASSDLTAQLIYNNNPASPVTGGTFNLPDLKFGQFFVISVNMAEFKTGTNGTIEYVISSQSQILAQEEVQIETQAE